eukprot:CAMPEP_0115010610 /NCGR_PEP_ID=MMETSP0216-20121206/23426_1 /TAXON_ID=223996 /ORGANISM="Protocruzia adherens, Strain Boccale" /LENGTH=420 /DNA_ID=CAMNT_0002378873 /DNA_START=131 /DNA_END=1393 /DNA_ORIENTATION=-
MASSNETDQKDADKENVMMDFSHLFTKKVPKKRVVKKTKGKKKKSMTVNNGDSNDDAEEEEMDGQDTFNEEEDDSDLQRLQQQQDDEDGQNDVQIEYEIPMDLTITAEEMAQRKVLDLRRWYCMSRPQYKSSCGISSLVSCWNYLFSTLGAGKLQPISQEHALKILQIEPPYTEVAFGSFTGNKTLLRWFSRLNHHFGVKGKASVMYKMHGADRTIGIEPEEALARLVEGLRGTSKAFIYHCQNHYFCPIGFEFMPLNPADAYKRYSDIPFSEFETSIAIGEPSRAFPSIHFKKWRKIVFDIEQQNPDFYDIRREWRGAQRREGERFTKGKRVGGNLHGIMEFQSLEVDSSIEDVPKTNLLEAAASNKSSGGTGDERDSEETKEDDQSPPVEEAKEETGINEINGTSNDENGNGKSVAFY